MDIRPSQKEKLDNGTVTVVNGHVKRTGAVFGAPVHIRTSIKEQLYKR